MNTFVLGILPAQKQNDLISVDVDFLSTKGILSTLVTLTAFPSLMFNEMYVNKFTAENE